MSALPRVTEHTRERISREFDNLGPDACMAEISQDLRQHNPELLDMARKCAADVGNPARIMLGFGMFYRLLTVQSPASSGASMLHPLPRVSAATRDRLVGQIDAQGSEAFTLEGIDEIERNNPELLQMAHNFAARHSDYLGIMQGFALLYKALIAQSAADRMCLQ